MQAAGEPDTLEGVAATSGEHAGEAGPKAATGRPRGRPPGRGRGRGRGRAASRGGLTSHKSTGASGDVGDAAEPAAGGGAQVLHNSALPAKACELAQGHVQGLNWFLSMHGKASWSTPAPPAL